MKERDKPIAIEEWLECGRQQQFPPRPEHEKRGRRLESPLKRSDVDPLPAHVGLWLDRCLIEPGAVTKKADERHGREFLYRMAVDAFRMGKSGAHGPALKHYEHIYKRWEQALRESAPTVVRRIYKMRATSRILLHPATQETVTEGGLLLHHTYGVPYIPGSALKGAARGWAVRMFGEQNLPSGIPARLSDGITWIGHLFGLQREGEDKEYESELKRENKADTRQDTAGIFDFLDALLVTEAPADVKGTFSALALDVVNPHHGAYYTKGTNRAAPAETNEPIPTHLLTISPKTTFLLAVETRESPGRVLEGWLDWMVVNLLAPALQEMGIGARTTAGYGRLDILGLEFQKGETAPDPKGISRAIGWVSFIKGSGTLRATFEDGSAAEMRGPRAKEMLDALSEGIRGRIQKGKSVRLYVEWELAGNAKRMIGVAEG